MLDLNWIRPQIQTMNLIVDCNRIVSRPASPPWVGCTPGWGPHFWFGIGTGIDNVWLHLSPSSIPSRNIQRATLYTNLMFKKQFYYFLLLYTTNFLLKKKHTMKILAEASDENGWFLSLISVKYFSRFKSLSLLWYIKGFPASMLFTASSKLSRFSVQNEMNQGIMIVRESNCERHKKVVFDKRRFKDSHFSQSI